MSRVTVGDLQITLVRAGVYHWDGGAVFGVVPKTLWSKRLTPDERNLVPLGFNCYVVETGEHTVLIETGGGDKMDSKALERMKMPTPPGPLPETISRHGIDPERIDIVVNTHLHWDHCGGNTQLTGGIARPAFPRAVYYTRRGEWEHARLRHPRDAVSYIGANYDPLIESGRMKLLERDGEVAPGIRLHVAPGHNRDMMVVTAASGGETFCFFSDLVPTTAHLAPAWVAAFDLYPLECIDTKMLWLGRAARDNWICGLGHDCELAFTRVKQSGTNQAVSYQLLPVNQVAALAQDR
jgi:glyoxylase-like metal-dependent hydrolase (beta-lactamase superfamily II)